jgi:hypothetical protein
MSAATSLTSPRAVAYARYSSEQQRAASIDDQLRNCRRRADDEGRAVIREYADRAITGADSSRPQYREMLSAADRREFDILLVDYLSRLAPLRQAAEAHRLGEKGGIGKINPGSGQYLSLVPRICRRRRRICRPTPARAAAGPVL